jgi:hypothetical protein
MIDHIKKQVKAGDYRFTVHSFERCVERNISPNKIMYAMIEGEVIEDYADDKYGPSCLIYGIIERRQGLACALLNRPVWIITAYVPTLNQDEWDPEFKRRIKKS